MSARHLRGSTDNPWRRWCPFGKLAHARGEAATLLVSGWLPRAAAARAMGMSLTELDRAVINGAINTRKIGPGAELYEVMTP